MAKQQDIKIKEKPKCGVIMPISGNEQYSQSHWTEVLSILKEVANDVDFNCNIVSYADQSAIIQKTIVQNIYSSDIIICDVSGKNPNVMFELGLRLAFDKPTIVIKDDLTDYTFDTGIIEHLAYPSDLNYYQILNFKKDLKAKIISTHDTANSDPNYSTFLKNFGNYKVVGLEEKEVTDLNFIVDKLEQMSNDIARLEIRNRPVAVLTPKMRLRSWFKNYEKNFPDQILEYQAVHDAAIRANLHSYFKSIEEFKSVLDDEYFLI